MRVRGLVFRVEALVFCCLGFRMLGFSVCDLGLEVSRFDRFI